MIHETYDDLRCGRLSGPSHSTLILRIPLQKVMCPSWDVFINLAHDWYHFSRPLAPTPSVSLLHRTQSNFQTPSHLPHSPFFHLPYALTSLNAAILPFPYSCFSTPAAVPTPTASSFPPLTPDTGPSSDNPILCTNRTTASNAPCFSRLSPSIRRFSMAFSARSAEISVFWECSCVTTSSKAFCLRSRNCLCD